MTRVRLLLQPSRLVGRTTSRLLGRTLALLAPLALGVTQRVLLALIGIAAVVVSVLVLVAVGIFGG